MARASSKSWSADSVRLTSIAPDPERRRKCVSTSLAEPYASRHALDLGHLSGYESHQEQPGVIMPPLTLTRSLPL